MQAMFDSRFMSLGRWVDTLGVGGFMPYSHIQISAIIRANLICGVFSHV